MKLHARCNTLECFQTCWLEIRRAGPFRRLEHSQDKYTRMIIVQSKKLNENKIIQNALIFNIVSNRKSKEVDRSWPTSRFKLSHGRSNKVS